MKRTFKADSPAAYADVKFVMDMAVAKPGLRYVLSSSGKAVHFKQRCNKYRNLLRDIASEQVINIPGFRAETAYDILVILQINEEGKSSRTGNTLLFNHQVAEGVLIDPDTGEQIKLPGVTDVLRD
jgi:hypothetical protein